MSEMNSLGRVYNRRPKAPRLGWAENVAEVIESYFYARGRDNIWVIQFVDHIFGQGRLQVLPTKPRVVNVDVFIYDAP